jgi:hypothetical protein
MEQPFSRVAPRPLLSGLCSLAGLHGAGVKDRFRTSGLEMENHQVKLALFYPIPDPCLSFPERPDPTLRQLPAWGISLNHFMASLLAVLTLFNRGPEL